MPIKIIEVGKRHCPAGVCDQCGERITDAEDGNVLWVMTGKPKSKLILNDELFLTHKKCNRVLEKRLSQGRETETHIQSKGLDVFIAELVQNLGVTLEGAKRTKHRMDLLGLIE